MNKLSDFKPGDEVTYIPRHAKMDERHPDRELGIVTSVNDTFVFARYGDRTGSQATSPADLQKGDHTFTCHNENNSVLDGAFGRCKKVCSDCRVVC